MSDFVDRAGRVAIRNALLKASKVLPIVQGYCGRMPLCGARWREHKQTWDKASARGCCILCAYLTSNKDLEASARESGSYPEELAANDMGVDVDWLMSAIQGFDGEELANENRAAYRIGQSLWRLFSGDDATEEAS